MIPFPRLDGNTIIPIIESKVRKGVTVYTDEYRTYRQLRHRFNHKYVNHSKGKYVIDEAHTNGIENFWSILKKNLTGTYHSISKYHLQRYINEVAFKYNNKEQRFNLVLQKATNVRIEYKQLIRGT